MYVNKIVLSLVALTSLRAANVVSPCTLGSGTVTLGAPNTSFNLVCPQFNVALGTLTSVDYFDAGWGALSGFPATVTLRNDRATATGPGTEFPLGGTVQIGPFPGSSTVFPALPLSALGSHFPLATLPGQSLAPGATGPLIIGFGGSGNVTKVSAAGNLSPLQGGGTYLLPVTIATFRIDPTLTLLAYTALVGTTSANVVYYYNPVPEPALTWFCGLCLAGLVVCRKRAEPTRD